MRRADRLALPAGAVLAAVLVAGCGTTVPIQTRESVGSSVDGLGDTSSSGGSSDGLGDTSSGGSGSLGSTAAGGGSSSGLTTGGSSGGSSGTVGGGTSAAGGSTSTSSSTTKSSSGKSTSSGSSSKANTGYNAIAKTGPGWDAKSVYIGVTTVNDIGGVATALGLKNANPGNQVLDGATMIAELNREGGLFGRKAVLVANNVSTASMLVDADQDAAQACTHFTQDRRVVAVWNTLTPLDTPTFRSCFAQAKIPLLSGSIAPTDTGALNQLHGYATSVISPSFTDLAPTLVARLKAEGYFSKWNTAKAGPGTSAVKVGIITNNTPTGSRAAQLLSGALAQAGYAPSAQFNYTVSASGTSSNLSSAVLQFRSRGITHVFSTDNAVGQFIQNAGSQHYYPRYAMSSFNTPALLTSNVSATELRGAMGLGSDPSIDVDFNKDPGNVTAGEKTCLSEQQKSQSYSGLRFAEAIGLEYCDAFRLVRAAALAAGGLTGPDIAAGLQKAGPTYDPAITFASGLHTNDFALPGAGRDLAFEASCSCFAYTSKTNYRFG
jgi:hypothetical protein